MKCDWCGTEYEWLASTEWKCPNCVRISRREKWKIELVDAVLGMGAYMGGLGLMYLVVWAVLAGIGLAFGFSVPFLGD